MLWLCIEPERREKTLRIMSSLGGGCPGAKIIEGAPPDDGNPFVVWGQKWLALELIPKAIAQKRPFWQLDNGFWNPDPDGAGYYRLSYRGLSPILLRNAPPDRAAHIRLAPWRTAGRHILFAIPGLGYGKAVGLDMPRWVTRTRHQLRRAASPRVVRERIKASKVPLANDLRDCWALVTHSSNVAVDAVIAGIPVIVAPSNPAAPVGNLSLDDLANPKMPERQAWLNSLACQQFTLAEMNDGTAHRLMSMIAQQVDAT